VKYLVVLLVVCFSLEETVEGLQTSLQQHKEQLQQKEVTHSVLQEQFTQVKERIGGCGLERSTGVKWS